MTAPDYAVDPVWAFIHGLPPSLRHRLNRTQRLVALIHAANGHGWTTKQLVAEASRDQIGVVNTGALIMHRLEGCAEGPPPKIVAQRVIPFCSPDCAERRGFLEDDVGRPIGKCPCRTPPPEDQA